MSVHIATGLSTTPDARAGALEAASAAARALNGRPCDLAVLFASGAHLAEPEVTLAAIHEMLGPMTLVGCGAGGVISDAREVEDGTAVLEDWSSVQERLAESRRARHDPR